MTGGKRSQSGTPQGGVISPLLANLYRNRFLKYWRQKGKGREWRAVIVNYADDFVILSRGGAAEALEWTARTMARIGLTLNREKTKLVQAKHERFDFLGYTFGPHRFKKMVIGIGELLRRRRVWRGGGGRCMGCSVRVKWGAGRRSETG